MITIDMPCNIGDKIYTIVNGSYIQEVTVVYATISFNDQYVKAIDDCCGGYTFRKGNFGYNVFLTREEAEKSITKDTYNLADASEKLDNKPLWFCKPPTIKYTEE